MSKKVAKGRPARAPDLTGEPFDRWTVLGRAPSIPPGRNARWHCRCDCGTERDVYGFELRNKTSRSCGCWSVELTTQRQTKHGQHKTKLYKAWTQMIQRCTNPNDPSFPNYGGRGITVAPEFRESFTRFAEAMGPQPSPSHTIERVKNELGYQPGNVRWATRAEQLRNKRTNHNITFNDETKCLEDWATTIGISQSNLIWRLKNWPLERALTEPSHLAGPKSKRYS